MVGCGCHLNSTVPRIGVERKKFGVAQAIREIAVAIHVVDAIDGVRFSGLDYWNSDEFPVAQEMPPPDSWSFPDDIPGHPEPYVETRIPTLGRVHAVLRKSIGSCAAEEVTGVIDSMRISQRNAKLQSIPDTLGDLRL